MNVKKLKKIKENQHKRSWQYVVYVNNVSRQGQKHEIGYQLEGGGGKTLDGKEEDSNLLMCREK